MKILKIVSSGYKICEDNLEINFMPIANKTMEDKEYEFSQVEDGLDTFSSIGIVGKNASGKTMILRLLSIVYDIISEFQVTEYRIKYLPNKPFTIDITFIEKEYLYRYTTSIKKVTDELNSNVIFENEKIYRKKYAKTKTNKIFDYESYNDITEEYKGLIPEGTSKLFYVINTKKRRGSVIFADNFDSEIISSVLKNVYKLGIPEIYSSVLEMFDEHLEKFEIIGENTFIIKYKNKSEIQVPFGEINSFLSSGTIKGIVLLAFALLSLEKGADLIIDEIENHFHKTLVENLINIFKDKSINKNSSTIIFSTHSFDLLDLFHRSDNIYITSYDEKIKLTNMYNIEGTIRNAKSKKVFDKVFKIRVSYDSLMNFKKLLIK